MKKTLAFLLALMLVAALTACSEPSPEKDPNAAPNEPESAAPSEEEVQPPQLKSFTLKIEDGRLYILYPDGCPDENVDYYDIAFDNAVLMKLDSGVLEADLTAIDLSSYDTVTVGVTAWETVMNLSFSECIDYEVPIPEPVVLTAPAVSVAVYADRAVLTVQHAEGAKLYEIYVNGVLCREIPCTGEDAVTYSIEPSRVNAGTNEVYVRAVDGAGASEQSETLTVEKLADPEYHATGTGVEVIWGDVEHAQGYALYMEDDTYIATMELSGHYDFAHLFSEEGFYMCQIQAVADGCMSSKKCGIPVMIGDVGGPIGQPTGE